MTHLPHIAARLFDCPLLIHPGKLHAIVAALAPRFGIDSPIDLPDAYTTRFGMTAKGGYRVIDGIAVIDVFGLLAHRGGLQANSSYVQGYDAIAKSLDIALTDR